MPPNVLTVSATTRSASPAAAMSARIGKASVSSLPISSDISCKACSLRPTHATFAPALANALAQACPIPEVAPVTSATLPANLLSVMFPGPRLKLNGRAMLTLQSQKADYYHPGGDG